VKNVTKKERKRKNSFLDADALSLSWSGARNPVEGIAEVTTDFCGQARGLAGFLGASSSSGGC
jgi:hypothetical protein